jgi:hypothetical protein
VTSREDWSEPTVAFQTNTSVLDMWGSDYKIYSHVKCDAILSDRILVLYLLLAWLTLGHFEAMRSSETSVNFYKTTHCHIPGDSRPTLQPNTINDPMIGLGALLCTVPSGIAVTTLFTVGQRYMQALTLGMSFCTCAYKQKYSSWTYAHALTKRNIPREPLHMRLQTEIFHLSFCTCTYKEKYSSWASSHALTNRNIPL